MAALCNSIIFIQLIITTVYTASLLHQPKELLQGVNIHHGLNEHSKEFNKPEVIKVNEHVYVGVGYGIANCIFILAPQGTIIVDSMESTTTANAVLDDFKHNVSDQPVKGIIYTHFHGDHNEGTRAFIEDSKNPPEIWAHRKLEGQLHTMAVIGPILFKRGIRQFGFLLPQELPWYHNNGIGPSGATFFTDSDREVVTSGIFWPTNFVEGKQQDVTIAGLQMTLVNIPGETQDHLGVWIPSFSTFMCGDNLYKTYPNIYTIRGTIERDPLLWVESLDLIRNLKPEYLVPSHTKPVIGGNKVKEVLTKYRDGIQLLHDQTLRFINKGYHPSEAASKVQLPPQQQQYTYLQQYYGTLEWSAKAVHNKYFGWFSGTTEELFPLTPLEQSKRIDKLVGGVDNLLFKASHALDKKDFQWSLELATHILRIQPTTNCTMNKATKIRREALKGLAEKQSSPNGRYFYLTTILEDSDAVHIKSQGYTHFATHLPLDKLFRFMSFWLKAEECGSMNRKILFNFTDIEGVYLLHLRNGITKTKLMSNIVTSDNIASDCEIICPSDSWRDVVGGIVTHRQFYKEVKPTKCNKLILETFLKCFDFMEILT